MPNDLISLCSVSWIDAKPLPKVGFWMVAGAAVSWSNRVVMGLAATANPEPPQHLLNVSGFRGRQQYRALTSCCIRPGAAIALTDQVLDPGYTPPFDKSKVDTRLVELAPIADDPRFHPGERSGQSAIVAGKLHPCSTLTVAAADRVIVSALIKFRAGAHTDKVGIEEAKSPYRVPWVWCEYALVASGNRVRLLAQGSKFPSHAWYVAGHRVALRYQDAVAANATDPALSSGPSAKLPASQAELDHSAGPVDKHQHTIGAGLPIEVDVTNLLS